MSKAQKKAQDPRERAHKKKRRDTSPRKRFVAKAKAARQEKSVTEMTRTLDDDSDGEAAAPRRAGKRSRSDAPAPAPPRAAPKQTRSEAPRTTAATMSRQKQAVARKELISDIDVLRTRTGETRDYNTNRLILTIALQMRLNALNSGENMTNTELAGRIAELCPVKDRGGTVSVFELLREWDASKSVLVHSAQTKGHKPRHLSEEQVAEIERFIETAHNSGAPVTNATIRAHMRKDRAVGGVEFKGIELTRDVVSYPLKHFLGFRFNRIRGKAIKRDPKLPHLIRQYLVDFSDALELEGKGTHVIVNVDESYIHQNAGNQFSYFKADDRNKRVEKTSGRGAYDMPTFYFESRSIFWSG